MNQMKPVKAERNLLPATPATNQHINTDEFVFPMVSGVAVRLAVCVLIPIKQTSSQRTTAP